jgi:hypothetical protein
MSDEDTVTLPRETRDEDTTTLLREMRDLQRQQLDLAQKSVALQTEAAERQKAVIERQQRAAEQRNADLKVVASFRRWIKIGGTTFLVLLGFWVLQPLWFFLLGKWFAYGR